MIELQLSKPPSANHLWIRARKGMRKSPAYVTWLMLAAVEARKQGFEPISGPYKLAIQYARPDKRRRDIDNVIKPISDLMVQIGAVSDDCQMREVSACWVDAGRNVLVRIEPLS